MDAKECLKKVFQKYGRRKGIHIESLKEICEMTRVDFDEWLYDQRIFLEEEERRLKGIENGAKTAEDDFRWIAHLNHFLELYCQRGYSFLKALLIVGVQLGYTVIFGWYAAFLFIRTGNLLSPIVAHIFCNVMGLPVLSSSRTLAFRGLLAASNIQKLWLS
ncbi:CAAX prenyl protease 2 [Ananas comosus]|uniref:intramembrane prenyl-peptidase Rce1 n=1 Tax=Ananas comosus TaxID=4615 RepID=A0A199UYC9_ANACO|nr:CAAX prenyl protease 2 [Ananas comosus]